MMKLIADSGATKTDWACITNDRRCIRFSSAGYNPNYITADWIVEDITSAFPSDLNLDEICEVFFYGAGITKLLEPFMKSALQQAFPKATKISAATDLIGASRALLGDRSGFAAILGTGMNSGIYDGKEIAFRVGSLGFILGDEGSGAYLGKLLIRDFMRHRMSDRVYEIVKDRIRMTDDQLIDQIYKKPMPNRFCAQFGPFIKENLHRDDYFYRLVRNSFTAMFEKIIFHYPAYEKYEFNSVGSIAYCFRDILAETAHAYQMRMGIILRYPLDGLITYHNESLHREE
ncbi:hypothetical protein [Phocaeicola abscessus]|uniref:hypothetical protein n=1 Tax=Phocaeicola abscessus TaxID=555313 RepID=UPI0003859BAC|nr:hypothetical protein [Phocaeicola abscessus]EPT33456.1 hypothetical protein HMPREF9012_1593 [Bacteroidetes bacterium oral taxon 272 str. F0290]